MAKTITDGNIKTILNDNKIVVMDFWAEWCNPCKTLSPIIDRISNDNEDILVGKVNVDNNSMLASEYGVRNIPMLVFLKDGKMVSKTVGVKSDAQIQDIINSMK